MTSKEKKAAYDRAYHKAHPNRTPYTKAQKIRRAARVRAWRKENLLKVREYEYRKKYGLTWEDRDRMLADQGGACKICQVELILGSPNKRDWPHTDHSKKTGQVRGILCASCNTAIGLFKENTVTLFNAIQYLRKFM